VGVPPACGRDVRTPKCGRDARAPLFPSSFVDSRSDDETDGHAEQAERRGTKCDGTEPASTATDENDSQKKTETQTAKQTVRRDTVRFPAFELKQIGLKR